jgi:uncharacterized protein YjbJ (UPF0337 family)
MELFRLFGTVLIDDKDAIESLKKVDNQGKTTKTGLSDMAKKGAVIGTAVVAGCAVAVGGLLSLANSTSDTAAGWLELSQRTDIGVESLQRWGYAASQSGADVGKLEVGMKKLSTSIVDAQGGSEKAIAAYDALGISMSDLSKMSPEQTFDAVMAKLADMPASAEKNVIGNQLLGKSYTELKPLLDSGSAGMEALKNKADELGIVMSEKNVVAAEGFGDSMDNVKLAADGIKNNLMTALMPQLTGLMDWFVASMPAIQDFVTNALDKVSIAIQWIGDNSNILLPILGAVAAAFVVMQVIGVVSALMTAWTTVTTVATAVQTAFNAVMAANPIALVIIAIVALIAIGVSLWKNWDTIKEKASEIFGKLKEVVGDAIEKVKGFFQKIIDFVKDNWQGLLLLIVNPFAGAFKLAYDNCEGFRNKVNEIFEKIKGGISDKINAIKTTISNVFGLIKAIMSDPFEAAKTAISLVIDKIKGFLNFNWEFPKLKMPHFSFSGSMNPLKWAEDGLPKIGVEWYAKGGIFDRPTIFNTPYGLKGVGDASSPEIVAPLSELNAIIREEISNIIQSLFSLSDTGGQEIVIRNNLYLDGRTIYENVKTRAKSDNVANNSYSSSWPDYA